ncbi:fructose-bisphosphatase class III [Staphylococcus saprophyticus]|uniref:metallophosphoesterase n=1 Tax=Staphylococcus saprophyticus TaxID=29385 RepID=UPI0024C2413E|nr:metallophosphoesterase [Staphylococcus saprophyticus]MDK1672826.1 fructose-bisphosphatase class III [Staphylococcus saprophyticus]
MSIFVVPDIHGEYHKLIDLMNKINEVREPEDKIIFLGDYIDRGRDSNKVIDYIFDIKSNDDNIITLLGNHDDAFWQSVKDIENLDIYNVEWFARYCIETLESYGINTDPLKYFSVNQEEFYIEYFNRFKKEVIKFKQSDDYKRLDILMTNCKLIHRENNYIFTHSGGVSYKEATLQNKSELLWSRDFQPRNDGYIHVCGHTPTISGKVERHNDMMLCDVGAVCRNIDLPYIKLEE